MNTQIKYKPIHESIEHLRFQPKDSKEIDLAKILHEIVYNLELLEAAYATKTANCCASKPLQAKRVADTRF